MISEVKKPLDEEFELWDEYVRIHPESTVYHLSGWKTIIEKSYGHKSYYLLALRDMESNKTTVVQLQSGPTKNGERLSAENSNMKVVGILPLFHLKHFIFGNSLISLPFFDTGGILADDEDSEHALLSETMRIGRDLNVSQIELRHITPLSCLDNHDQQKKEGENGPPLSITFEGAECFGHTRSHKVRMVLDLPESSEALMKSFKAKLRSQIKKPLKEGLSVRTGNMELLNDFYKVFSINMRDLGSPVHSRKFIQNVLDIFPDHTRILNVYKGDQPLACSLVVGFKDILENPWASALREYSALSPNMLLYWAMMEHACNHGFRYFDFGRSSPDEGTYKFKEQWGAKPTPLYWYYVGLNGNSNKWSSPEKSQYEKAVKYWQKLPVPLTRLIGPGIRKYIGL